MYSVFKPFLSSELGRLLNGIALRLRWPLQKKWREHVTNCFSNYCFPCSAIVTGAEWHPKSTSAPLPASPAPPASATSCHSAASADSGAESAAPE